jgi:hypothetical protein
MQETKPNLEWCYTLDEFYNRCLEKIEVSWKRLRVKLRERKDKELVA